MELIEIVVILLVVGNIVGMLGAYTAGRSAGAKWGYEQGMRVAKEWESTSGKWEAAAEKWRAVAERKGT